MLAGQKRLKNKYKDPGVCPKIKKADVAWTRRPSKRSSDHVMVS